MSDIRTISWDPGVVNFAYSFRINGEIIEDGLIEVLDGVENDAQFTNFAIELLVRLKPNRAVAERYMYRGKASKSIEYVNLMLGKLSILVYIYCGIVLRLITPAQWKMYFKKQLNKQKGAKFSSKEIYPDIKIEHIADARCIGKYLDDYWH